ncbi:hypothetical protein ACIGW0_07395 [Streptomyces bikiniensis]|uniref:Uncharacterized protein n=1 Tax=Streptomyces bikiniensis TaxID=1896 RepID=A0ABW8CS01_STRBI
MIEEATVDACTEDEQSTGLFTLLEEHLASPFTTTVLGVEVIVRGIDLTPDGRIVAMCTGGRVRRSIGILELPFKHSTELKGRLVTFAQSARFDRWLAPLLLEAAGLERQLDEGEAIRITDRFILWYRLPDGSTVVDRFVTGRKDVTASDREMLLGWRDPVEGVFEIRRKDGDAVILLNLADDLEYRTYSNVGRAAFRGGLDLPFFELPSELADSDTVGVIYDQVDSLDFYADYGMLRDLFADPVLAGRKRHQDLLRTYLREESITPLPIGRLASAHPETVDAVFRKLLRKPGFTWSEHGDALLRRRKPRYYESDPRPGASVIGDRLSELLGGELRRYEEEHGAFTDEELAATQTRILGAAEHEESASAA